MIFLKSVPSAEAREIDDLFRANGIPLFVEYDYSIVDGGNFRRGYPPDWCRVSICIDEQLDDARNLLVDSGYKVKYPVDVAKFDRAMDSLGANKDVGWKIPDATLNIIAGTTFVGFVLWVIYAVLTS